MATVVVFQAIDLCERAEITQRAYWWYPRGKCARRRVTDSCEIQHIFYGFDLWFLFRFDGFLALPNANISEAKKIWFLMCVLGSEHR